MPDPKLIPDLHGTHPVISGKRVPVVSSSTMDQNSRENLVRLRKRSILQNQKATVSLEEFWTTEASLREYFYDLPGPQVELPAVLLHLSPDHNKA